MEVTGGGGGKRESERVGERSERKNKQKEKIQERTTNAVSRSIPNQWRTCSCKNWGMNTLLNEGLNIKRLPLVKFGDRRVVRL